MTIDVAPDGVCQIEGKVFPAVGFGTYRLQGEACEMAFKQAIETGYRIFDTATYYDNFVPTGQALKTIDRADIYLISKVWHDSQTAPLLQKDFEHTLKELGTDYLDAYFIHWPNSEIPIEETLGAMNELRKQKRIQHIGLSNVTSNHLRRALEVDIPISWVQVEMHPHFFDAQLLTFCHQHAITVQAWAPLLRGAVLENPFLVQLAQKYAKTPAQVALRWMNQHQVVPLPSSNNTLHMKENFEISGFSLTQEEMGQIDATAKKGQRKRIDLAHHLNFTDEFDFSYEQCWPRKA